MTKLHGILHQNEFHILYFGFSMLLSLESSILVSLSHGQIELMHYLFSFAEFIWNLEKVGYVNLCDLFYETTSLFGTVHYNCPSVCRTVKRIWI